MAGEDGRATIDGSGRDGAGVETVIERVNLVGEALLDEGVLRVLRRREVLHLHLLAKLCNLVVLVLDAILAELVSDALSPHVLVVNLTLYPSEL